MGPTLESGHLNLPKSNRPKILIDARMVSSFEHGISRYVTDIATGFATAIRDGVGLPFQPVFLIHQKESALLTTFPWSGVECHLTNVGFLNPREWIEIPRLIRSIDAKAFHSPSFASFPYLPVPYLVTVHDLIHLQFGTLAQKAYYATLVKPFTKNAKVLATVSGSARAEISGWLKIPADRIEIHPNAFLPAKSRSAGVDWISRAGLRPQDYFLAVANDKPHKNLQILREAHLAAGLAVPLVVAHEFLDQVDPKRKNRAAFDELFDHAHTIVSPSLAEGFGRVPVEAVLRGLPVLLSSIPAHTEIFEGVARDGVRFCEARDLSGWIEALQRAVSQPREVPTPATIAHVSERFQLKHLMSPLVKSYEKLLLVDGKAI